MNGYRLNRILQIIRAKTVREEFADPVAFHLAAITARAKDFDVGARKLGGFEDRLAAAAAWGHRQFACQLT